MSYPMLKWAACALFTLTPLAAAIAAETAPAKADEVETITVTGSRLKGVDMEGAMPITVLDEDDIADSGAKSVIDLLKTLPQMGGGAGTFSTSSSGALQADSPAGSSGISLRGLGTSSTLTLVNGRRVSVSSFANGNESFVDVNAIPLAAIKRVEVLTSGASAIYGADAVAGVVNFILKEDFEGVEIGTSYGESEASSADDKVNFNITGGTKIGKTHVMGVFDYFKRNALYRSDREITAVERNPSQQGIWPSFSGRLVPVPPATRGPISDDYVEAGCPAEQLDVGSYGEYCAVNRNAYSAIDPGLESYSGLVTVNVDLASDLRWKNELMYSSKTSQAHSSPAPWDEALPFDHPGISDDFRDRLLAEGLDPTRTLYAYGRFPDARTIEVESDNFRLVSGLQGSVADWDWQSALSYGENKNTQNAIAGIYNREKLRAALFGELCADGTTGCAPGVDGLYYDPFNGQALNSQQVLDLVREQVPRDGKSTLLIADASISGALFELPAGDVASAFGVEFRKEKVDDEPSELAKADPDNNNEVPVYGFGSTEAHAERDVWAAYAEFAIPLTEQLELSAAARYDDYESFGGDISPKLGLRYQPLESTIFRASYAESFRAPSLAQVGAGTTLGSGTVQCGGEFLDTVCGGDPDFEGYYDSEIYGNDDLEAETAKSYNAGVVFSPSEDFTISLDYWRYRHDNLVGQDADELLRQAIADPSLVRPCDDLSSGSIGVETESGALDGSTLCEIHLQLENLGTQETDGFDLSSTWYLPKSGSYGNFSLLFDASYLNSFDKQLSKSATTEELAGEWRYPQWRANAKLRWELDDLYASLGMDYTGDYNDDDEVGDTPEGRKVPSWTIFTAYMAYDVTKNATVSLAVDNLFDKEAPYAYGSSANVDLLNHDTMGRYYTLGLNYRF
ncbi:MAG: TonB-dependent receptor [Gammaproteobacteria bacterium]|nr:TonB-dependent receptor [Gammaproteobacteria bacterium]